MIDFPHKSVNFSVKLLSSSSLFYSPVPFSILYSSYPFFLHFQAMRFSACSNFCWSLLPGNTHTLAHCQFKPLSNGQMLGPMDLSKKRWFRLITMLRSWFILGVLFRQVILINLHTVSLSPIKLANARTNGLEKKRWFRLITMLMSWFNWSFTHQQIHFMKKNKFVLF